MALAPDQLVDGFRKVFGGAPVAWYQAPGRVNLIGEHTDYNYGFVFPIAIHLACSIVRGPATDGNITVYSAECDERDTMPVADLPAAARRNRWSDYVWGVARLLAAAGHRLEPAHLYLHSDVPAGSGLSSSAALEVAAALALLGDATIEPLPLARLCQQAEIEFVGVPCGIMDQYASVFGRAGAAICLDCRDLTSETVLLPRSLRIVAVNSMVKHELGTSAYRQRVAECNDAVAAIRQTQSRVESLRDVTPTLLHELQDGIAIVPRRRARHVVTENERVLAAADAARAGALDELGRLFVASHRSMQYDYEISCEEIDFLVDTGIKLPGVYGARMTGGGFGGCTVNLVAPERLDAFKSALSAAYQERYQIRPLFYDCEPGPGAHRQPL